MNRNQQHGNNDALSTSHTLMEIKSCWTGFKAHTRGGKKSCMVLEA